MPTVQSQGMRITLDHPALWVDGGEHVVRDLIAVLGHRSITHACLRHLVANRQRLVAGQYVRPDGRGCVIAVLTEPLGERQIRTKGDLLRFFGPMSDEPGHQNLAAAGEAPEYQPAKWLVRLVDGQFCERTRGRYRRACELFDFDLVIAVARQILQQISNAGDAPSSAGLGSTKRPSLAPVTIR